MNPRIKLRPLALLQQQRDARQCLRLENAADGSSTDMTIMDEIGWWGVTAGDVATLLASVDSPVINLALNSPGGEIFDGIAIKNALQSHPATVNITVTGLAASIASVIAMAGDTVAMAPGSQMMIHEGAGLCFGNASDMQSMADLLDRQSDNIAAIYADRAGGNAADWRGRMQAETWYTAQEAVDAGLADKVLPSGKRSAQAADAAPEAPAARDLSVFGFRYAGRENAPAPTLTAAAPEAGVAIAVHHTATVDEAWDGPAAVAAMPNEYADLHYCHAWQSASANASSHTPGDDDVDDEKQQFKFPHHLKKGGPANVAACRNGLARLDGANISDEAKTGVKAHLQAHLDDAEKDADEAKKNTADAQSLTAAAPVAPAPTPHEPAAATTPVDGWAALTARLTNPRTSGDVLRAFREAHQ